MPKGGKRPGTGPKPKLIALQDNSVYHDTKENIEKRKEAEVVGCSDNLKPPKELSERAQEEWDRLIPLYRQLNYAILNDLDLMNLAAYCESVAVYTKAELEWPKQPLVGMVNGKLVENPHIKIMAREAQNMCRLAEQLCLSPVGRARMGMAALKRAKAVDPMEAFLEGNGYEG